MTHVTGFEEFFWFDRGRFQNQASQLGNRFQIFFDLITYIIEHERFGKIR